LLVSLLLAVGLDTTSANARPWPESNMATAYAARATSPYVPSGGVKVERATVEGSVTTLELEQTAANHPRHDVDMGRTRVVLRNRETQAILIDETLTELWECLGFNPRTGRYLIVSKNESGVKVTLRGLLYVDEPKAAFIDSIFGNDHFHAVASLYESGSGVLALIGWKDTGAGRHAQVRLYALHTSIDVLVELGPPPAPPPLSSEELRLPMASDMVWPWHAPERHYTELGPGIWRFANPTRLDVSYGPDTVRKRSPRRWIKRFDLTKPDAPTK
jgi:hypothetical protein